MTTLGPRLTEIVKPTSAIQMIRVALHAAKLELRRQPRPPSRQELQHASCLLDSTQGSPGEGSMNMVAFLHNARPQPAPFHRSAARLPTANTRNPSRSIPYDSPPDGRPRNNGFTLTAGQHTLSPSPRRPHELQVPCTQGCGPNPPPPHLMSCFIHQRSALLKLRNFPRTVEKDVAMPPTQMNLVMLLQWSSTSENLASTRTHTDATDRTASREPAQAGSNEARNQAQDQPTTHRAGSGIH